MPTSPSERTSLIHHDASPPTTRRAYSDDNPAHQSIPSQRNSGDDDNDHDHDHDGREAKLRGRSERQAGANIKNYSPPYSYEGNYPGKRNLRHELQGHALADEFLGDGALSSAGEEEEEENNARLAAQGGQDHGKTLTTTATATTTATGKSGTMSTTQQLTRRHGVRGRRGMYLAYYFPFVNWIRQYKLSFLQGDLVAAITMASFYIPMSLSYAENLAHLPPIQGLYSFVFNPFVYGLFGTCPQMVVGPEAAGSLLVGTVIMTSVEKGRSDDDDGPMNARVAGVVTGMAGAVIFIAGLTRLGFLDSVLSRPFLRGFISAIGFVILVDQLIPETGLSKMVKHVGGVAHASSAVKVAFLVKNVQHAEGLTCAVAFGSFTIIMVCRYVIMCTRCDGKEPFSNS